MCPKCMVRNGNNNNYRQVVLPLVYQSHLLLKTVLAVAANRLKLHSGGFQTVALRYQNMALKGLQQSIITKKRTWFSRIEILSIILMLCFFDIYDPSPGPTDQNGLRVRPWATHSHGIRHLLEEETITESQDTQYEQAILSFHSQYFISRSILTYTAMLPHEDQGGILQSAFYWLDMADRPANEINPFAGCSNKLLRLILSITYQLRRGKCMVDPRSNHYKGWANKTRRQLMCIQQYSPTNTPSDVFGNLSDHNWNNTCSGASVEQTAECFRLAALILLESIPSDHSESRVSEYLSHFFQLLQSGIYIPPSGKLGSSSYFWPCFVAGCHLRCPRQQACMFDHLAALTSDSPGMQASYTMARQIQNTLVDVWAVMRDYNLTSILIDNGDWSTRFVWEDIDILDNFAFEWV
jgi:Fungal specific transcription factor domain